MVQDIFGNIPTPPANVTGTVTADIPDTMSLAGGFDDAELKDVQKLGDLVVSGTYAVRATKVDIRMDTFVNEEFAEFGPQPSFSVQWKITESGDMTNRVLFENVGWLDAKVAAILRDKNNPQFAKARELQKSRLGTWKAIKEALGVTGNADPVKVLPNCELKAVVVQATKNKKDDTGEWVPTEEKKNKITKYLSLHAQR